MNKPSMVENAPYRIRRSPGTIMYRKNSKPIAEIFTVDETINTRLTDQLCRFETSHSFPTKTPAVSNSPDVQARKDKAKRIDLIIPSRSWPPESID